ncbi:MAG: hypothetical protein IT285_12600 [Bdellovibrionales bacterium]|nr:hypothetical protein [Bdellovibrionales bacterium]
MLNVWVNPDMGSEEYQAPVVVRELRGKVLDGSAFNQNIATVASGWAEESDEGFGSSIAIDPVTLQIPAGPSTYFALAGVIRPGCTSADEGYPVSGFLYFKDKPVPSGSTTLIPWVLEHPSGLKSEDVNVSAVSPLAGPFISLLLDTAGSGANSIGGFVATCFPPNTFALEDQTIDEKTFSITGDPLGNLASTAAAIGLDDAYFVYGLLPGRSYELRINFPGSGPCMSGRTAELKFRTPAPSGTQPSTGGGVYQADCAFVENVSGEYRRYACSEPFAFP